MIIRLKQGSLQLRQQPSSLLRLLKQLLRQCHLPKEVKQHRRLLFLPLPPLSHQKAVNLHLPPLPCQQPLRLRQLHLQKEVKQCSRLPLQLFPLNQPKEVKQPLRSLLYLLHLPLLPEEKKQCLQLLSQLHQLYCPSLLKKQTKAENQRPLPHWLLRLLARETRLLSLLLKHLKAVKQYYSLLHLHLRLYLSLQPLYQLAREVNKHLQLRWLQRQWQGKQVKQQQQLPHLRLHQRLHRERQSPRLLLQPQLRYPLSPQLKVKQLLWRRPRQLPQCLHLQARE
jgi:hypothetical protein